jgi:hypothetical protein
MVTVVFGCLAKGKSTRNSNISSKFVRRNQIKFMGCNKWCLLRFYFGICRILYIYYRNNASNKRPILLDTSPCPRPLFLFIIVVNFYLAYSKANMTVTKHVTWYGIDAGSFYLAQDITLFFLTMSYGKNCLLIRQIIFSRFNPLAVKIHFFFLSSA